MERQQSHSEGETREKSEDLKFKEKKAEAVCQQRSAHSSNIVEEDVMCVQHFPLAVSPYSQDHAETDFQKHSFCYFSFLGSFFSFFFFLNTYISINNFFIGDIS